MIRFPRNKGILNDKVEIGRGISWFNAFWTVNCESGFLEETSADGYGLLSTVSLRKLPNNGFHKNFSTKRENSTLRFQCTKNTNDLTIRYIPYYLLISIVTVINSCLHNLQLNRLGLVPCYKKHINCIKKLGFIWSFKFW